MAAENYLFNQHDHVIANAAKVLVDKLTYGAEISPVQRKNLLKMQLLLSRLPCVTHDLVQSVSVKGPQTTFGDIKVYHYWTISVENDQLSISGSGHYYHQSTGGDSFSSFRWSIASGIKSEFVDNTDRLVKIPGIAPFEDLVDKIDFSKPGYEVEIDDSFADDDEELALTSEQVVPTDAFERELALIINARDVASREAEFAYQISSCDLCGCSLNTKSLFVDGSLKSSSIWANMCAKCFCQNGSGLSWGVGQLYARQPSGCWRLVHGFNNG